MQNPQQPVEEGSSVLTFRGYITKHPIVPVKYMGQIRDFTGCRLGKLEVIELLGMRVSPRRKDIVWGCICECGAKIAKLGCNLNAKSVCDIPGRHRASKPLYVLTNYRSRAKHNRIEFTIEESHFLSMIVSECEYCGLQGTFDRPIGVDRVDNRRGYVLGNVVPCCEKCNMLKWRVSKPRFLEWVCRVYEHQNNSGNLF